MDKEMPGSLKNTAVFKRDCRVWIVMIITAAKIIKSVC